MTQLKIIVLSEGEKRHKWRAGEVEKFILVNPVVGTSKVISFSINIPDHLQLLCDAGIFS